jgi:hypothetical protein
MYLYFTHLSIQTHPGLVINQVQEGATKLYRVKWPCYHYLLHHVLPHGLWPHKQRKQRKGILEYCNYQLGYQFLHLVIDIFNCLHKK